MSWTTTVLPAPAKCRDPAEVPGWDAVATGQKCRQEGSQPGRSARKGRDPAEVPTAGHEVSEGARVSL